MSKRFSVEAVFKGVDRITAPVSRMQQRLTRFTRNLQRGLRSASRASDKLAATFQRGGKYITGVLAGVAFAINRTVDRVSALNDRAQRLDFNIEELQEWQYAANQSGVSTEAFDSSIAALTRRLGRARSGTGALYGHLRRTDRALLRNVQAAGSVSEAFDLVIQSMREMESPTERAALASAAFNNTGTALISMAQKSREEVDALKAAMRENGVVTQDMADTYSQLGDTTAKLKNAWQGFLVNVLLPLVPIMNDLVERTRAWLNANRDLSASAVLEWVEKLIENGAEIVKWLKRIGKGLVVFFVFNAVLKTLVGILTLVNLVMAANPVVLIILAFVALGAAIAAAIYWWREIAAAVVGFGAAVRDRFLSLPKPIQLAIAAMLGPIGLLAAGAAVVWKNWDWFAGLFRGMWDSLSSFVREKVTAFAQMIANIRDGFLNLPGPVQAAIALITGPLGLLAAGAAKLWENWDWFAGLFSGMWDAVAADVKGRIDWMLKAFERVRKVAARVGKFLGIGGGDADELERRAEQVAAEIQVVSPQERTARSIEERRSTADLTIRDLTGRAEFDQRGQAPGINFSVVPTGAF